HLALRNAAGQRLGPSHTIVLVEVRGRGTTQWTEARRFESRRPSSPGCEPAVKVWHLSPTVAPVPVSRYSARLRFLGDSGSGTCVTPSPRRPSLGSSMTQGGRDGN